MTYGVAYEVGSAFLGSSLFGVGSAR